jgi:hypothetical protein
MEDETNTGETGKVSPRTRALMVAVAVITLIAVWLVPVDEQPETPPLPELSGTGQDNADLPPLEGDNAASREGDRARSFVAGLRKDGKEADPQTVFAEAERLQGEGYTVDSYLLYRFAARHGHGQAALILGTQADATYHAADDAGADEPEQAYKWYSIADDAGVDEAEARLQALRLRVEKSASAGNERAQRLMLQWQ